VIGIAFSVGMSVVKPLPAAGTVSFGIGVSRVRD
jgi:hypothetical protein